ncbi:MAG: Tol-Pal system beta propeller repeat protein TolB [Acidobacteriota bacterium]
MMPRTYLVVAMTALAAGWAPAQQNVRIDTWGGVKVVNIALPDYRVAAGDGSLAEASNTIHTTIWEDLLFSGYFIIIPREHYKFIPVIDERRIKFKDWASLDADLLLVGTPSRAGDRLVFSGTLYDVKTQSSILSKSYGGEMKVARLIGHQMANEILRRWVGLDKNLFTSKIACISDRDGNKELYVMDYDGQNQTRITFNKVPDLLPSWSPDGRYVVFTSYRNNNPDLFSYSIYEGKLTPISTRGLNTSAAYSPDGSKIAFSSSRDGNSEIYLSNPDGSGIQRLTNGPAIDTAPSWAPNGRSLAFTSDRGGIPQIYVMDVDGADVHKLQPQTGSYNDSPAWSPDGEYILYVSREGNEFNIMRVDLFKQTIVRLTSGGGMNENPSWSPDGRHLAFASNRTGSYQIWCMDAEGGNLRQLTTAGPNYAPEWSR